MLSHTGASGYKEAQRKLLFSPAPVSLGLTLHRVPGLSADLVFHEFHPIRLPVPSPHLTSSQLPGSLGVPVSASSAAPSTVVSLLRPPAPQLRCVAQGPQGLTPFPPVPSSRGPLRAAPGTPLCRTSDPHTAAAAFSFPLERLRGPSHSTLLESNFRVRALILSSLPCLRDWPCRHRRLAACRTRGSILRPRSPRCPHRTVPWPCLSARSAPPPPPRVRVTRHHVSQARPGEDRCSPLFLLSVADGTFCKVSSRLKL